MRTRFGEVFNAKLRHNILSVIAIALFLFALVVTIIALTKTPAMEEIKKHIDNTTSNAELLATMNQ